MKSSAKHKTMQSSNISYEKICKNTAKKSTNLPNNNNIIPDCLLISKYKCHPVIQGKILLISIIICLIINDELIAQRNQLIELISRIINTKQKTNDVGSSFILLAEAKGVAGLGKAGGDGSAGSDKAGQQVPPEVYIALTYAAIAFLCTLSVPLILYFLNKLLNKIEDCFGCGPSSKKNGERDTKSLAKSSRHNQISSSTSQKHRSMPGKPLRLDGNANNRNANLVRQNNNYIQNAAYSAEQMSAKLAATSKKSQLHSTRKSHKDEKKIKSKSTSTISLSESNSSNSITNSSTSTTTSNSNSNSNTESISKSSVSDIILHQNHKSNSHNKSKHHHDSMRSSSKQTNSGSRRAHARAALQKQAQIDQVDQLTCNNNNNNTTIPNSTLLNAMDQKQHLQQNGQFSHNNNLMMLNNGSSPQPNDIDMNNKANFHQIQSNTNSTNTTSPYLEAKGNNNCNNGISTHNYNYNPAYRSRHASPQPIGSNQHHLQ